jgi:hypothetical protein
VGAEECRIDLRSRRLRNVQATMTKRSTTTVSTLHPCPRRKKKKKKKKPRKDPTHHVVDDDDLPFLDDWFLKSETRRQKSGLVLNTTMQTPV